MSNRYALLGTVKSWVKSAYQECDDDTLVEVINSIRQEWFSWYADTNLFVDVEECFEVQDFCDDCSGGQAYRGVTLPHDYAAPEAIWTGNRPIPLRSRWRLWQEGFPAPCDCGIGSFDRGDSFASERDIMPARPTRLKVVAMDGRDIGKTFTLEGTYEAGAAFRWEVTLSDSPQTTDQRVRSIAKNGGVTKDITVGRVVLAEENGRILSYYAPKETVAAYKRIQLRGLREGCDQVFIRAARNFVELADDNDVVETGNRRAWEDMAHYLRLHRKSNRDANDIRSETQYRASARMLLLGDKSRNLGKSVRTDLRMGTPAMNMHRLRRASRR